MELARLAAHLLTTAMRPRLRLALNLVKCLARQCLAARLLGLLRRHLRLTTTMLQPLLDTCLKAQAPRLMLTRNLQANQTLKLRRRGIILRANINLRLSRTAGLLMGTRRMKQRSAPVMRLAFWGAQALPLRARALRL